MNGLLAVRDNITPKLYVDNAFSKKIDESSSLTLDPSEELGLFEHGSLNLTFAQTSLKVMMEIPTRAYVDSLSENDRNRKVLSAVFNDQDSNFDKNKITDIGSVPLNRTPTSDNNLANKKSFDDSLGEDTILRFKKGLEKFSVISIGDSVYTFRKKTKNKL